MWAQRPKYACDVPRALVALLILWPIYIPARGSPYISRSSRPTNQIFCFFCPWAQSLDIKGHKLACGLYCQILGVFVPKYNFSRHPS